LSNQSNSPRCDDELFHKIEKNCELAWIAFFKQTSKADLKRLEECGEEVRKIEDKTVPYSFGEFSGETRQITWYRPLKGELP